MHLIKLRESEKCEFEFPEWLFDMDCSGHYFRRIKSVSLNIPYIVGPYSVNATLFLLSNKIRKINRVAGEYTDDENYRHDYHPVQYITTSHAQNDSGMFEFKLQDERYLPFEGAGVLSKWRLELPEQFRQFDYETITDIILDCYYTSRKDDALAIQALEAL